MVSLTMALAGQLDEHAAQVWFVAWGRSPWRDGLVVDGTIDAHTLATRRILTGRMTLRGRTLEHRWKFTADNGSQYDLKGKQRLSISGMPAAFTLLEMSLLAGNTPIGSATLRFDPRTQLGPLLRSLRLW